MNLMSKLYCECEKREQYFYVARVPKNYSQSIQ